MEKIITWDEPKRQANIAKHGCDFADLTFDFFLSALVLTGHTGRLKAIGVAQGSTLVVIYIELGREALSVVSMRQASKQERKEYAERI